MIGLSGAARFMLLGRADLAHMICPWAFVALRVAHSIVQAAVKRPGCVFRCSR
jgi:hypothetical protein